MFATILSVLFASTAPCRSACVSVLLLLVFVVVVVVQ